MFWESAKRNARLGARLQDQEPGPFGFSVEVANLKLAHKIAEQGFQTKLPIEKREHRTRFLVSAKLTSNLWLEFVPE